MFTADPKFRKTGIHTDTQKATFARFQNLLATNGVNENQIIYVGGTKHYIAESKEIVEQFLAMVQIPPGATIFSDKGHAFFHKKTPIIPQLCGAKTATYPPVLHHYISPNDNHHHGAAKAKWRAKVVEQGWGKDHSLESCLYFLFCLNTASQDAVRGYFTKNFCLDRKCVRGDRCLDLVSAGLATHLMKNEALQQAEEAYQAFMKKRTREDEAPPGPPPTKLRSTLDGTYRAGE